MMNFYFLFLIFLLAFGIIISQNAFAVEIVAEPEHEIVGPNDWLRIFVKINGYSGGKIDWSLIKPDGTSESGYFENIQASKVTHTIVRDAFDHQFGIWQIKYQYQNVIKTIDVDVIPLIFTAVQDKQIYTPGDIMTIRFSTDYFESNAAKSVPLSIRVLDQYGKPATLSKPILIKVSQPITTQKFFIDEFLKYNTFGKYNAIVNYYGVEVDMPFEIVNPKTKLFVFLSSDKNLYDPGDTIEINIGIPVITVDSGVLTITSPSGKVITQTVSTYDHLTKVLLKDITSNEIGTYTYTFKYSGTLVSKTFDVLAETLENPKNDVLRFDLHLDKSQYIPGETISAIVIPNKMIENELIYWIEDSSGNKSNLFTFPDTQFEEFTIKHTIPLISTPGTWKIYVKYGITEATANFEISDIPESTTNARQSIILPDWIRNNAKWWNENKISDNDFSTGIEYMIKEKIILIPELKKNVSDSEILIPSWIKVNAGWWADELISDQEFVTAIEYLVNIGIIHV